MIPGLSREVYPYADEWHILGWRHYHSNTAAGARAFRQAIDTVMEWVKVSDYAEEHEKLKTALTKWGAVRTGFQMQGN